MKNEVDYKRIADVLENEVQIRSLSPWAQFSLMCLGYEFYDKNGNEVHKYQLWDRGYDDVQKLLNEEYPIVVNKRTKQKGK